MEGVLAYWPIIGTVVNVLILWVAWSLRQVAEDRLRTAMGELHQRLTGHGSRITKIEETVAHLPQHAEIQAMKAQFAELHGDMKALAAELRGMRETNTALAQSVNRIHDFLLKSHP